MSHIEISLTDPNRFSLRPKSSQVLQRRFAHVSFIITSLLLLSNFLSTIIVEDLIGLMVMLPVIVAAIFRKHRLASVYAIWSIITIVLLTMDIFSLQTPLDNPILIANFFVMAYEISSTILAYKIYSPIIHNEHEIFTHFEETLKKVKSIPKRKFEISSEALAISDKVGVFRIFSSRSMSLVSCLAPFLIIFFSKTSSFGVENCYSSPQAQPSDLLNITYCTGNMNAGNVSLDVHIWQMPFNVILELIITRAATLTFIYMFLRETLLLHQYRAKLFGAGVKFAYSPSYASLIEDYIWNFQAIFMFSLLETIVPYSPSITGLTPINSNNLFEVPNLISGNQTNPPGQSYYVQLSTWNYTSQNLGLFMQFVLNVALNCSFIISVYGYYHNSNNSALLTYFTEKDLIGLASKWHIRIKYQIENKDNEILKIIDHLRKRFHNEKIEDFVEALLIVLEENEFLKRVEE